ncbi:MAG: hypothetical protein ACRET4_01035, partial [Steroidobacteraceae bacterium]
MRPVCFSEEPSKAASVIASPSVRCAGSGSLCAGGEQTGARVGEPRPVAGEPVREHALARMLEVSAGLDAVRRSELRAELGAEHGLDLLRIEHEEAAFLALAVRVLTRVEAAGRVAHLALEPGDR